MSFTRKVFLEGVTYHQQDWTDLQDNIGTYYDALIAALQGQVDGILLDYLTSVHTNAVAPHPNLTLDNVGQGAAFIKLSAAEYARFLTGFYDILDSVTTVKFGEGRSIAGFYFANGADADGADIYGNDLFSRGNPVYTLVYASPWALLTTMTDSGALAHALGYRPSFGIMQVCSTDPTGAPEDYIYTEGIAAQVLAGHPTSYAAWNNTYYRLYNNSSNSYYFRILLFAYLGS
jgi:hypothetical protein